MIVVLIGLSMAATGCGAAHIDQVAGSTTAPSPASAAAVTRTEAEEAFKVLGPLEKAWKERDCAAVRHYTTWAENVLGRACPDAAPDGDLAAYRDPEFFLPEDGGWFAALARAPRPAYFVFARDDGRWRLASGPIPVVGDAPAHAAQASPAPGTAVRARLVPQRHLTYLTDPAGVSGIRFPAGDPMRELREEVTAREAEVELLPGGGRTLALSEGAMLVFHALRVTGGGKTELVLLATEITAANKLSTVAVRRAELPA
ncbi:hypothetical protein [Thermoactinospora rubra]|uniref:hypothetical protein n=1 Tax=Thermoactinospora rubra TaxID=1088767 RepID=UPI001180ACD9|nr:hypothetical protein [Thermoactinospora rubra]